MINATACQKHRVDESAQDLGSSEPKRIPRPASVAHSDRDVCDSESEDVWKHVKRVGQHRVRFGEEAHPDFDEKEGHDGDFLDGV